MLYVNKYVIGAILCHVINNNLKFQEIKASMKESLEKRNTEKYYDIFSVSQKF